MNRDMEIQALHANFELIGRLKGFLSWEALKLFSYLRRHSLVPDRPVLEIGVFCGRSLAGLACAFPGVKVVGVDPFFEAFSNSPAFPFEAEDLTALSENLPPRERLKNFWSIIRLLDEINKSRLETSVQLEKVTQETFFKEKRSGGRFQLCHVDGEHTYTAVIDCLDRLDHLLYPGAWLVIDDFLCEAYPDISEAVHRHPGFRKAFWPVLYGFNKGVFVYQPGGKKQILEVKEKLQAEYASPEYFINHMRDDTPAVQRKPVPASGAGRLPGRILKKIVVRTLQRTGTI